MCFNIMICKVFTFITLIKMFQCFASVSYCLKFFSNIFSFNYFFSPFHVFIFFYYYSFLFFFFFFFFFIIFFFFSFLFYYFLFFFHFLFSYFIIFFLYCLIFFFHILFVTNSFIPINR